MSHSRHRAGRWDLLLENPLALPVGSLIVLFSVAFVPFLRPPRERSLW